MTAFFSPFTINSLTMPNRSVRSAIWEGMATAEIRKAAVLLMSEERARADGLPILGRIRSYAFAALDPADQLLQGPVLAVPTALERAGIDMRDVGLMEMHEAFAAQVLAVLELLDDETFCRERLGRGRAVGKIDRERLNAWGGSASLGHPFGATGARLIMNCCHRLAAEGSRYGLIAACAAGAIGIGLVLERA